MLYIIIHICFKLQQMGGWLQSHIYMLNMQMFAQVTNIYKHVNMLGNT